MVHRSAVYDVLALSAAVLVLLAGVVYARAMDNYDLTTLLVSVIIPLLVGTAILYARGERIALFAFLAYFWAVVDDRPVFFDSVLTWPQVTRFHPFLPRLYMNIVIHGLTLLFLYLTIQEAANRSDRRLRQMPVVIVLALAAFALAYAQNIPLAPIQSLVQTAWYPFDVAEKLASVLVLCIAIWLVFNGERHRSNRQSGTTIRTRLLRSCYEGPEYRMPEKAFSEPADERI